MTTDGTMETLLYVSAETGQVREVQRAGPSEPMVQVALGEVLEGRRYSRVSGWGWRLKADESYDVLTIRLWPPRMDLAKPCGVAARIERGSADSAPRLTVSMAGLADAVAALDAGVLVQAVAWAWLDRGDP
ncbi:MAG: hypothetical protein OXI49_17530 [Acidobacteriota bacterium]|nr:hypothetical protein [Acidobacteriota bacterium]